MGFDDEYRDWVKKFPGVKAREIPKGYGELVVVFERGNGPIKVPRNGRDSSLPRFTRRYSEQQTARVQVDGASLGDTKTVLDIEALSSRYLEDRIGRMFAAKLAGTAVKGALAYGVGRLAKSEDLGLLTFLILNATDRADLRSWRTLPADLQLARVAIPAGTHNVVLQVLGPSGDVIYAKPYEQLKIRAGRKIFLEAR